MIKLIVCVLICTTVCIQSINAKYLEKVSMQFHWLDQFEFAGYYVAKEKGFYRNLGLDVELKNYKYGMNVTEEVLNKRATFAVGGSDLMINMNNKSDIKLLFATFQSSPLILLTTSNSGINTIKDFKDKRIMITPDAVSSVTFNAMMKKENLSTKDLVKQEHSFDVNDLINDKTDLFQSYISNEPYELKKQGITPVIFNPKDYGFDLYSDIVFTSTDEIKNNKQRVINFKKATLQGWKYAFENIEETVEIILQKYNSQNRTKEALIYEAYELKKLAFEKNKPFGNINKHKLQRIFDAYNIMNLVNNPVNIDDYIINDALSNKLELTLKEKEFIKNHPIIKMGGTVDSAPTLIKNNDGSFSGIDIDISKIIYEKTGLRLVYENDTWNKTVQKAMAHKIDGMSASVYNKEREKYFNTSVAYFKSTPKVFVKRGNPNNIKSIKDLHGKKTAVRKGTLAIEKVLKNFDAEVIFTDTTIEMIDLLIKEEIDYVIFFDNLTYIAHLEGIDYIDVSFSFGKSEKDIVFSFRKDWPELTSIVNKVLNNIPSHQKLEIRNKWFNTKKIKNQKLKLTQKEKEYLLDKGDIKMCIDPNWMPFESFDDRGKHIGISADYFKIFRKELNIPIEVIKTKDWNETIQFAKNKRCDIISLAMETPNRKKYLNFTSSYLEIPLVLATKLDKPFVNDFTILTTEKIGIPSEYAFIEILKLRYPNLNIVEVSNEKEGLEKVVKGELFGYVGVLSSIGYLFQKEFTGELKVSGRFEEKWELGVAVRNDEQILFDILEKHITQIDELTKQKILNNWLAIRYEKGTDYIFIVKIVGFIVLILLFFIYRHFILKKRIKEEIEKSRRKDNLLYQQNKMASIGNMIETIAHQWRQPLSELSMSQNMILRMATSQKEVSSEKLLNIVRDEQKILQFMSNTINTFEDFYQRDTQIQEFQLKNSFNDVKVLLIETIKLYEIKLIEDIDESLTFNGAKNYLSQVLLSILQNSIYFLKNRNIKDPEIYIKIEKKQERMEIQIEDNAGGIEDEIMNKIFDYNVSSKEKMSTGIGLYISKLIMEDKFLGNIEAKNTKTGVKFILTF